MSTKEEILSRYRRNMKVAGRYDMPDLDALKGIEYPDVVAQFTEMSRTVGGNVVEIFSNKFKFFYRLFLCVKPADRLKRFV